MLINKLNLQTKTINALNKKKIYTTDDLVRWIPRSYRDYRHPAPIWQAVEGQFMAIKGLLRKAEKKEGKRKYLVLRVESMGGDNSVQRSFTVLYFSRIFMYSKFLDMVGTDVVVCGKISYDEKFGFSMSEPDILESADKFQPGIMTVYPKVGGVSDNMLREIIDEELKYVKEPLEWELMQKYPLIDYKTALTKLHHPEKPEDMCDGIRRLRFNDLLYFALGLEITKKDIPSDSKIKFKKKKLLSAMVESLPYSLTDDQKAVINDFCETADGGKRIDMLLQGDVGCGKTVVAIALMLLAADNGYQAVLMAPREVLARQHYESVCEIADTLGLDVAFLHAGMKARERRKVLDGIQDGSIRLIVGTHSCLADAVEYHNLGVIVTDEEHLFGVEQKEQILLKAQEGVHSLSMSATPIPRTIASVLYGDRKKVSVIKTMPAGRLPIKTAALSARNKALPFMKKEIEAGHQCYVVCPAIDENEEIDIVSIESIEEEYRNYFEPLGYKVGVVNGKMDKKESEQNIAEFASGATQVLISTTVIEVGVNVPNATVMVVEQAERFGLASLHQLRGRVGRSSFQSYCILLSEEPDNERLQTMVSTTDGFKIAEADLAQRGTGNLLGVEQAGQNKYIELMLTYPKTYEKVKMIARYCVEMRLGERIEEMYNEHLACLP